MWGRIDQPGPNLLELHLALTNHLTEISWKRSQIWNNTTSVHEWQINYGPILAFDVVPSRSSVTVTLVVRSSSWAPAVKQGLEREGIKYTPHPTREGRFTVYRVCFPGTEISEDTILAVAREILRVREALEVSTRREEKWRDPHTGISVSYSTKPERKKSSEIIFMFTSIRTKHHWLDFNGPAGESVRTNRARIIFLEDNFASEFTYFLAINRDSGIKDATASFIREYVDKHSYSWDRVTLAGMSKGGSSALIIGSALPRCNVVALAPQLELGPYLLNGRAEILRTITGQEGVTAAEAADALFWDSIESISNGIANCYILTSGNDPHCTRGIDRLRAAIEPKGIVSIHTDLSSWTSSHMKTVHHLSSAFLSLLAVLTSGMRPTL